MHIMDEGDTGLEAGLSQQELPAPLAKLGAVAQLLLVGMAIMAAGGALWVACKTFAWLWLAISESNVPWILRAGMKSLTWTVRKLLRFLWVGLAALIALACWMHHVQPDPVIILSPCLNHTQQMAAIEKFKANIEPLSQLSESIRTQSEAFVTSYRDTYKHRDSSFANALLLRDELFPDFIEIAGRLGKLRGLDYPKGLLGAIDRTVKKATQASIDCNDSRYAGLLAAANITTTGEILAGLRDQMTTWELLAGLFSTPRSPLRCLDPNLTWAQLNNLNARLKENDAYVKLMIEPLRDESVCLGVGRYPVGMWWDDALEIIRSGSHVSGRLRSLDRQRKDIMCGC